MIAVARRIVHKHYVDFCHVPAEQWAMHDRLENWRRWSWGGDKQSGGVGSPMFALYRSSEARRADRYDAITPIPVDLKDAGSIQTVIASSDFPVDHRWSLHWAYLHSGQSPAKAAGRLGVSLQRLADLVIEARSILIERAA